MINFDFNNPSNERISVEIKEGELFINKGTGWADRNNSMERLLLTIKDKIDSAVLGAEWWLPVQGMIYTHKM
jgi:hypothetical protein